MQNLFCRARLARGVRGGWRGGEDFSPRGEVDESSPDGCTTEYEVGGIFFFIIGGKGGGGGGGTLRVIRAATCRGPFAP